MVEGEVLNWKEHILKAPDVYIGDIQNKENEYLLLENNLYNLKTVNWNEGYYNCLKEVIYNALDQKWRETTSHKLNYINITYESGNFIIENDGPPIKIKKRDFQFKDAITNEIETKKLYPPELFFGYFHTGSNYNKVENDVKTSGKNGMGIKIVNVLSSFFSVECCDGINKFYQEFLNNAQITKPCIVTTDNTSPYVKISFKLDDNIFHYNEEKILKLFLNKISNELSFIGNIKINLKFNKNTKVIDKKSFFDYLTLFGLKKTERNYLYFEDKLIKTYFLELDDIEKKSGILGCSFVNGSFQETEPTALRGTDFKTAKQTINKLICDYINKKLKLDETKITSKDVKHFFLYTELKDSNVKFDHQTKRRVTTSYKFSFELSNKHKKTIEECNFFKDIYDTLFNKKSNINELDIDFEDATYAGTKKSNECSLLITEGDSAKGFGIEGIGGVRDFVGVFPIKGKFLNISKASISRQLKNKEIQLLNKILNISNKCNYNLIENKKSLRYGKIVLLTDSDDDGIHIRALLMNYIYCFNKTLYDIKFVDCLNTPIIRIYFNNTKFENFYTLKDFEKYIELKCFDKIPKEWKIKYYKGLGSHNEGVETKDCFINKKQNSFLISENCENGFKINFEKGYESDRKNLIINAIKENLDINIPITGEIICSDYLKNILVVFYVNVLKRNIPNFIDGLKDSQRKIIYTVLKIINSNSKKEINVERLSGKVSETTMYHHGSKSLEETIMKMSQKYCGSNNIPFFDALGRVGTRYGNDGAAGRYVSVKMNTFFKEIFFIEDILEYNIEEFEHTEPKEFFPPIPFFILNYTTGITPGFKSEIYPIKLSDAKDIILKLLDGISIDDINEPLPYFEGFKGNIIKTETSIITEGIIINEGNEQWKVIEIPATMLISNFKAIIMKLQSENKITKLVNRSTNYSVDITFKSKLSILELKSLLKLSEKLSMNNYVVLKNGIPIKYKYIKNLLKDFVEQYLLIIQQRKDKEVNKNTFEYNILDQKIRFLYLVRNGTIDLKKTQSDVINILLEHNFIDLKLDNETDSCQFSYLLKIPVSDIFKDNIEKLENNLKKKKIYIEELKEKSIIDLYKQML